MSRFREESYYTYVRLTQQEITKIPEEFKKVTTVVSGGFMMLANSVERIILEDLTGEDLSCVCADWFIVEEM